MLSPAPTATVRARFCAGAGYFLGAATVAFNLYLALGVLIVLILLAMPWAALSESPLLQLVLRVQRHGC